MQRARPSSLDPTLPPAASATSALASNIASFRRHLAARNLSPKTERTYTGAAVGTTSASTNASCGCSGRAGGRLVVIGREAVRALDRYLRYREGGIRFGKSLRPHHSAHLANLWLGPKGAFTESGMGQMIHDRGVAAGLGDHVHPHMFRRTYAHKMLAGGMNETDLMTLAGWHLRTMVSRHAASAATERATEIAKRMSPGDTL